MHQEVQCSKKYRNKKDGIREHVDSNANSYRLIISSERKYLPFKQANSEERFHKKIFGARKTGREMRSTNGTKIWASFVQIVCCFFLGFDTTEGDVCK